MAAARARLPYRCRTGAQPSRWRARAEPSSRFQVCHRGGMADERAAEEGGPLLKSPGSSRPILTQGATLTGS